MLKKILLTALAVIAFGSVAEARPDTRAMTCAQAKEFVRENGPVVMTYGYSDRAGYLYSRISPYAYGCRRGRDDHPRRAWVQTLDSPACYVGYHCNI